MRFLLFILFAICSFQTKAEPLQFHAVDYLKLFRYSFKAPKQGRYYVLMQGWYLHYPDKGVRGLKPFQLKAFFTNTTREYGDQVVINSKVEMLWEKESYFWGTDNASEKCVEDFQVSFNPKTYEYDFSKFKNKCPHQQAVLKQIFPLFHTPFAWPQGEVEDWAGPNYMSHPTETDVLATPSKTFIGKQQFMWILHQMERMPTELTIEMNLIGKIEGKEKAYDVTGFLKSSSDLKLEYIDYNELSLFYSNRETLSYPKDIGQLQSFNIYYKKL